MRSQVICILESFREALVAALHLGFQVRLRSVSRRPCRVQQCEVPYTNVASTPRFSRRASCSDTPAHARLLWPAGGVQARIESFNAGAAVRRNLQCAGRCRVSVRVAVNEQLLVIATLPSPWRAEVDSTGAHRRTRICLCNWAPSSKRIAPGEGRPKEEKPYRWYAVTDTG